jgi:hypothetical protein
MLRRDRLFQGRAAAGFRLSRLLADSLLGGSVHRVTECRASRDYRLWLKFEDGLEGSVFLGDLLEVSPFSVWRDVDQFCRASVDRNAATVVWEGGIQLDPDILHQDLMSSKAAREFNPSGLSLEVE